MLRLSCRYAPRPPQRGALGRAIRGCTGLTLIEMALVLMVVGLMAALFLPMAAGMREAQQIKETRAKLAAIDAALVRFVMLNERLPCPADGALPETDPNVGRELVGTTVHGCAAAVVSRAVVPWRTLGLSMQDALDAWGMQITYRPWMAVSTSGHSLTQPMLSTPSACSSPTPLPPFASRTPAQWDSCLQATPRLGHRVRPSTSSTLAQSLAEPTSVLPTDKNTGAAYVLISHGPNRCGGYAAGGAGPLASGCPASDERQNDNGVPVKGNAGADGYIQAQSSSVFDDLILWRTIMQVAVEARKVQ